jgi:hypothetical protein
LLSLTRRWVVPERAHVRSCNLRCQQEKCIFLKTIIAGSRTIDKQAMFNEALERSGFVEKISMVISGGAYGVDQMGERWASINRIPVKKFLPDWERYGKAAGCMRNIEMARAADALIAVWDGESTGTKHMIRVAKEKGLSVYVMNVADPFVQAEFAL